MSYLNALRLHFAGSFQANTSTVNNDTGHFDTGTFKPSYQEMQGPGMRPPNGWFNPAGDGAWRLLGCRVTGVSLPEGEDPEILKCGVADSDSRVTAKLVDLDPQQQLVSEIWGLTVRVTDPGGKTIFSGDYDVAGFMDIWSRATGQGGGGDANGAAIYQSVLTNLRWNDVSFSPVLTALQQASADDGLLSIKFNVDGINLDFTSPDFMTGRIVGTIGPATAKEPRHLLLGRQFVTAGNYSGFFVPKGGLNFFPGRVDECTNTLFLDLGNAISTKTPGGALNDLGDLQVTAAGVSLGTVSSGGSDGYASDPTWYKRTAGVVALPLEAAQLAALADAPITITGKPDIVISESVTGAFIRADKFVYRLSPNESVNVPVYATLWGHPLPGTEITYGFDGSWLQGGSYLLNNILHRHDCPVPGQPTDPTHGAPTFNGTATTDSSGMAILKLTANNLGYPRTFHDGATVDGQVYGVRPAFSDPNLAGDEDLIQEANLVSLLAWSSFTAHAPVTWDVVQPILKQYANLYPVMLEFLDLGDYESVRANRYLLQLAFGLDPSDPNYMPVTRDLSPARRSAILAWLQTPLPASTTLATSVPAPPETIVADSAHSVSASAMAFAQGGGKAAALANRIGRAARSVATISTAHDAVALSSAGSVRVRLRASPDDEPIDAVRTLLQQAIELEHATIPVYLYGLYSLDGSKNAAIAEIIQSVVVEEMLHMTLAANVLNALGGCPVINSPDFIPEFPGHLPGGVESSLVVHLRPFSMGQLETYLAIEQPENPHEFPVMAMVEEDDITIGQFYHRIEQMIVALGDDAFVSHARNQIGPDQMYESVVVTNVPTATQALQTIVEQGEGTATTPGEVVGDDYAHYYRFMEIKKGRRLKRVSKTGPVDSQWAYSGEQIPFDSTGVYPVPDDPLASNYSARSQQRRFCDRFNYTYTALLNALHTTFNGDSSQLDVAIGLMMSLKGQARQMMSGTPNPAKVTGPSFEYQPTDPA